MTHETLSQSLENRLAQLARWIEQARYALALTGAGVSTESGIPDFRSPQSGLWQMVDPAQVASVSGFLKDPEGFYKFWTARFASLEHARPNITHHLLAELEEAGLLRGVITQNIDGLHRRAGSRRVFEVHGSYRRGICYDCHRVYPIEAIFEQVNLGTIPRCESCEGLLKPDVVLFGELLPEDFTQATQAVAQADLLIALGSSLEVYPVAELAPQAKSHGAHLVIVNREETPYDSIADLVIHAELGPAMRQLRELLADSLNIPPSLAGSEERFPPIGHLFAPPS